MGTCRGEGVSEVTWKSVTKKNKKKTTRPSYTLTCIRDDHVANSTLHHVSLRAGCGRQYYIPGQIGGLEQAEGEAWKWVDAAVRVHGDTKSRYCVLHKGIVVNTKQHTATTRSAETQLEVVRNRSPRAIIHTHTHRYTHTHRHTHTQTHTHTHTQTHTHTHTHTDTHTPYPQP